MLKTIAFAIFCFIAAAETACGTVMVAPLPASEYADTEVSTNIPLSVDFARMQKFRVTLELNESAMNGLEVLLGRDSNEDGSLSSAEASLAFGYDCGAWFVRETEADRLSVEASSVEGQTIRRELEIGWRQFSPDWNLARVTRRGEGAVNESVSLTIENKKFVMILK